MNVRNSLPPFSILERPPQNYSRSFPEYTIDSWEFVEELPSSFSYKGKVEIKEEREGYSQRLIDDILIFNSIDSNTREKYLNFWKDRKIQNLKTCTLGLVLSVCSGVAGLVASPFMIGAVLGGLLIGTSSLANYRSPSSVSDWEDPLKKCVQVRTTGNNFPSIYHRVYLDKLSNGKMVIRHYEEDFFHPEEIKQLFYQWCDQLYKENSLPVTSSNKAYIKKFMKFNPLMEEVAEFAGVDLNDEHITQLEPVFEHIQKLAEDLKMA